MPSIYRRQQAISSGSGAALDTNGAHIQNPGTQAPGANGLAADSGHVHPFADFQPQDHGLDSWAYDPAVIGASSTPLATAGLLYVVKLKHPKSSSITNVILSLTTGGSVLTSGQCFATLYQAGSLIGVTADQSAAWASTGLKIMPLVSGPFTVPAGDVYVGMWFNGTTGPAPGRSGGVSVVNVNLAVTTSRFGTANTGLTTTAPPTLATVAALSVGYWAALS